MKGRTFCRLALAICTVIVSAPHVHGAISDNLIFYLPLDANAADQSGNGVPTSINGTVTFNSPGIAGNAATISNNAGVNATSASYIITNDELSIGTSDFSVSVWVNGGGDFSVNQTDGTILSNKDWSSGGNDGWVIARGTAIGGRGWQWNFDTSAAGRVDFDPPPGESFIEDSQWHHIAVTHDRDGDAAMYFDGGLIGTRDISAHAAGSINTGLPTGVGVDGARGDPWDAFINGMVDEVGIWDRVLNGAEVQAIYDGGLAGLAIPEVTSSPRLTLEINRDSGEMALRNNEADAITIRGYSILSAAGALAPSNWTSIAQGADADSGGTIDSDDRWVEFTDRGTFGDVSEGSLGEGSLAAGQTFSLGVGTWSKYYLEELTFEYIDGHGDVVANGFVEYVGNVGAPFPFGDLNFDGGIGPEDWLIYVEGLGRDFPDVTVAQSYQQGDLNGDLANDHLDFLAFKGAYDAANGAGAFAAMIEGVPEPATGALLCVGSFVLIGRCRRTGRARALFFPVTFCLTASCVTLPPGLATAQTVLLAEDFEGLAPLLGPYTSPTENGGDGTDWTATPPAGWIVDNIDMSVEPPGVTEFEGWTFHDRDAWVATAGDQNRSQFTRANGVVAVADPDEWDDAAGSQGLFNSFLRTPPISLVGVDPGTVLVEFDSSWRDEDFQDAGLTVRYDDGPEMQVFLWESEPDSPFFKDDAENEHLQIPLVNPFGATSMVLEFGVFNAGNDWWWAIDNLRVESSTSELALNLNVNTATGDLALENNTDDSLDINFYQIDSPSGSLNLAGWNSLDDQNLDAIGPNPGESWDEGGGSNSHKLVEAFLLGSSNFGKGASLPLGRAFDTAGVNDLQFFYGLADGTLQTGFVSYVSETLNCDFDGDGSCALSDIDALVANGDLVAGVSPADPNFDLNRDGTLNQADIDLWLEAAGTDKGYTAAVLRGDANLDGVANASDLNQVGINWLQSGRVWSQGDFNGDGVVNAADLNLLGINWLSQCRSRCCRIRARTEDVWYAKHAADVLPFSNAALEKVRQFHRLTASRSRLPPVIACNSVHFNGRLRRRARGWGRCPPRRARASIDC